MKIQFALSVVLYAVSVQAQLPPYVRNPITTNSPAGMTNVVDAIARNPSGLVTAPGFKDSSYLFGDQSLVTYGQFSDALMLRDLTDAAILEELRTKESFTNLWYWEPQWVDVPAVYSYSITGPSAPSLVAVTNNSVIQNLAFDNGDVLYAIVHLPDNLAKTNALFPDFYWEPHVHWSTVGTLDATHSNVTWRVEWMMAEANSQWKWTGTNQVTQGVTNNHVLYITRLGKITNNPPPNISGSIRLRLSRPASALRDYSNSHDVIFDGLDFEIPVGNTNLTGSPTVH